MCHAASRWVVKIPLLSLISEIHVLLKFAGSAMKSAQDPGQPPLLNVFPAQSPHNVMSRTSVWSEKWLAVLQLPVSQAAEGVGHDEGLGFLDVISGGMELRPNLQILTPVLSHRWANTPPPAWLNPSPKEVGSGSINAHPALFSALLRHSVLTTFEVVCTFLSIVQGPPVPPAWTVYWLLVSLLTPSTTSISPASGQPGPTLHLKTQLGFVFMT